MGLFHRIQDSHRYISRPTCIWEAVSFATVSSQRVNDMNELEEFHLKAYEISALYKEKMNKYHDQKIQKFEIHVGDMMLLFNSSLCLFPRKINSNWTRPFKVAQVFPNGVVELENKERTRFKVNRHRIRVYMGWFQSMQELIEAYYLDEI